MGGYAAFEARAYSLGILFPAQVLVRLRPKGRIVVCGGVSYYSKGDQNKGAVVGPSQYLKLAERGGTMKGFNIMMYLPRKLPAFLWKTLRLIWRGRLRMDEHVEQGIGAFPRAMETMFEGGHIGKLLVNVGAPVASASA